MDLEPLSELKADVFSIVNVCWVAINIKFSSQKFWDYFIGSFLSLIERAAIADTDTVALQPRRNVK